MSKLHIHVAGVGQVVPVPDGAETDYVIVGECGHVSPPYTSLADAVNWTCTACAEQAESDRNRRWLELQLAEAQA